MLVASYFFMRASTNRALFIICALLRATLLSAQDHAALNNGLNLATASSLSKTIVSVRTEGMESGSGIVVSLDGFVVTTSTLLSQNRRAIKIRFADGQTFTAEVVATDRGTESALLRIKSSETLTFSFLELGDSSAVKVGGRATSAGNPLDSIHADHQVAVSCGTITSVYDVCSADAASRYCGPALETDAAINAGSEGGALLNETGQVIGMVCLAVDGKRMKGTAVPINRIKSAYEKFLVAGIPTTRVAAVCPPNSQIEAVERAAQALVKIHFPNSPEIVTGIIIDAAGHVLTTGSFSAGQQLDVELAAGGIVRATVLRQSTNLDVSLLQLNSIQTFSWISLKENASILPGIQITVLDFCALCIKHSILTGIVSAVGRLDDMAVQTNARLTASNAGSAVLNRRGELIGVVSHMKVLCECNAQNAGVSFFTPAGQIRAWIDDMSNVAVGTLRRRGETR